MPQTSQQRLFTVILSASLLLATAGSANAEPGAPPVESKKSSAAGNGPLAPAKNPSLAYRPANTVEVKALQAQSLQENTLEVKTIQVNTLQGSVSSSAQGNANTNVALRTPLLFLDDLTESALHINQSLLASGQAPGQSASTLQNMSKSARAFVPNYFNYRPSRAAAQAFLGDGATAVAEQDEDERSQRNKLALTMTAAMMQIAKGLGDCDSKAAEQSIERGRGKLTQLIGKGQADWVISRMTSWAEQIKASSALSNLGQSDVLEQEEQVSTLVSRAVSRDQQISNLKASIAIHDKAPTGAERSLTLAGLTPNLIGPAAKLAQYAVERGTGGTRSQRLDDVLTLGLAMQERINLLTRESELAINNLERAKSTKNNVLYAFSQDLIAKLGGP